MDKTKNKKGMMTAILSLSLLTVMAGAAVAPALGTIREHFSDSPATVVQLIISMPALFIFLTSFIFPSFCKKYGSRTLVMTGLALYITGGCGAALFDNIWIVLVFRALVGAGVGFIMPLSTGLLSYYYPPEELDRLMGLSSAMNQMGGAVATFIAGLLATISWKAAFMVYFMGLISAVLCLIFLPNDMIGGNENHGQVDEIRKNEGSPFKRYFLYILAMFILMSTFFIYPSNYALEAGKSGNISQEAIALIMALMDVIAFMGGLAFVHIKKMIRENAHFTAPVLFMIGYLILSFSNGVVLSVIGSFFVGFANGAGVPCIIAAASRKAGKEAVSTVMPLISAALYLGQFVSPFVMSAVKAVFAGMGFEHLPFCFAVFLAAILTVIAFFMRKAEK